MDAETDKIIDDFYTNIIGPYWDKERRYIDENYQTIPFPFKEIESPEFVNTLHWTLEELTGYFNTWSAVQHYKKANNDDPVKLVTNELKKVWEDEESKEVRFPILLRVAKIEK